MCFFSNNRLQYKSYIAKTNVLYVLTESWKKLNFLGPIIPAHPKMGMDPKSKHSRRLRCCRLQKRLFFPDHENADSYWEYFRNIASQLCQKNKWFNSVLTFQIYQNCLKIYL